MFKKLILLPLKILEHNPEHSTKIVLYNTEINACSRCLGAYSAGLIFFPVFGYIYLFTNIVLPFWHVFFTSMFLASFTLVDWSTVHLFHKREGSDKSRIISGFLLGVAGSLYFWLLPESWYFRIGTLVFYNALALLLAYIGMRRDKKHGQEAQTGYSA
jgi:uncharacterized membrane protein